MTGRYVDLARATSERELLEAYLEDRCDFDTNVAQVAGMQSFDNPVPTEGIGSYRSPWSQKYVSADADLIGRFRERNQPIPTFLEAGPRKSLKFDPQTARVGIVTTGGLAPGLHSVVHAILQRHCDVYRLNPSAGGEVFGISDSFNGLLSLPSNCTPLRLETTAEWLELGGTKLGAVRGEIDPERFEECLAEVADGVARQLQGVGIDILYLLGGDGSIRAAHEIARRVPDRAIVCLPKTMDNDILWVSQSFGFATAVEKATSIINTMHREAESTRRVSIVELFGAESGFVAANATMASGHVDLVLVPEVFARLCEKDASLCEVYLDLCIAHVARRVRHRMKAPYAVVVVAEGVGKVLEEKHAKIRGEDVSKSSFLSALEGWLESSVRNVRGENLDAFPNQPRHYIRAVPANAQDQIFCERLGALAVDAALAGYTDCLVSEWLTEYVLVPLRLVVRGQKTIPLEDVFWKQVVNRTGQPTHHDAEAVLDMFDPEPSRPQGKGSQGGSLAP